AKEIIAGLPPFISKVGVFVNQSLEEISKIAEFTGLDTIQLHGDESPDFCKAFKLRVIKAFSVDSQASLDCIKLYNTDAYLLDTSVPGMCGGTGKTFDWGLAANFNHGPLILAGGLNAENVPEAISITRPYAVDISSGVETEGRKDINKITEFVRRVKN
ncbi:MAG: phosphoribosylanthranilate isomerase, partial [Desulfocucumaceae bacterium]